MSENWLQKTVEIPAVVNALVLKYTKEGINEITAGDEYKHAQAVLALALNEALNKTNLTNRKKRRASDAMITDLMNGLSVTFMLGYDCAKNKDERTAPLLREVKMELEHG